MPNRGVLLVLILLSLGIAAGSAAVWYHTQQTQRPLELWGTEGSLLIERAPEVLLYRLSPEGEGDASNKRSIDIGGQAYQLTDQHEISKAAGFSHVRWGLCQNSSFDWQSGCEACDAPNWNLAIRFVDGDRQITIALDTVCGNVMHVATQTCVSIAPIAAEVENVLRRQLPDAEEG